MLVLLFSSLDFRGNMETRKKKCYNKSIKQKKRSQALHDQILSLTPNTLKGMDILYHIPSLCCTQKEVFYGKFCTGIYGQVGRESIRRGYADHPAGTSNIITNDTSCEKTYHKEHPEKSGCFLNELFWKGEKKCAI